MGTWILEQEGAGSRPICILCFFVYRFTGAGVEVGDTESGEEGGRLGTTIYVECYQMWEFIHKGFY